MHGSIRKFQNQLRLARAKALLTSANFLSWESFFLAYVAIAIATFGVSASDQERLCANPVSGASQVCDRIQASANGFAAGLFWPLYWSWELQS